MQKVILFALMACTSVAADTVGSPRAFQLDCKFADGIGGDSPGNIEDWRKEFKRKGLKVVIQAVPFQVIQPAPTDWFWGKATIREPDASQLALEWDISNRMPRPTQVTLYVDRFSGVASLIWSQFEKENRGPFFVKWSLKGTCKIHSNKIVSM